MESKKHFFAVDLGATSGRTVIGTINGNKAELEEATRFENTLTITGGHVYWNLLALYQEIIKALKLVHRKGIEITSIGIDTWGVDFVCIGKDGAISGNPISYRDPHTEGMMEDYFNKKIIKEEVYNTTGIQFMNFNSLFQLYTMRRNGNCALENAERILFLPDALSWMLTGKQVCEYTIASTSQLLNPRTKDLDNRLLESVGLTRGHFGQMVMPGYMIGTLTEEVQKLTGLGAIPVIAVAGHDTASAVAAVPATDDKFTYLSSGTWSLMGIETKQPIINETSYKLNFTNEGGIEGTTRFLKNICGMWLLEQCRKEWGDKAPENYKELMDAAMETQPFGCFINPDDSMFANPPSMQEAICRYCNETEQHVPQNYAETCRCILESLAMRYKQVAGYLNEASGRQSEVMHIIGGGSQNKYLNQMTANATGMTVLAGPQECTALGNIMIQAKTAGMADNIYDMRKIIAGSVTIKKYEPQDKDVWNNAYKTYIGITEKKNNKN